MENALRKGWKLLLLLSIIGAFASIIMVSCGNGTTETKELGYITISPEEDHIPAGGTTRFIAYYEGTRRVATVTWNKANNTLGLDIGEKSGIVTVSRDSTADNDEGDEVQIRATNTTAEGSKEATVFVYPPVLVNVTNIEIMGLNIDPDDPSGDKYRAFTGKEFDLVPSITWENPLPTRWEDDKDKVIWHISGDLKAGTFIDQETGRLYIDETQDGTLKIWAVSKLTSAGENEEYSIEVNVLLGAIDSVELEIVGTDTYNALLGGFIELKATIDAKGSYTGEALFEVRPVTVDNKPIPGSRPVGDLTQVRTIDWNDAVTEAHFTSFKGELNKQIEVVARSRENPLKGSLPKAIHITGNDRNESADWKVIRMGRDHVIAIAAEWDGRPGSGAIYTWGANHGWQLGYTQFDMNRPISDANNETRVRRARGIPTKVEFGAADPLLAGDKWYQVSGGLVHSMALTEAGHLFMWGSLTKSIADGGAQQTNVSFDNLTEKERITIREYKGIEKIEWKNNSPWRVIYASHSAAYAINELGELYSWGYGANGALGYPSDANGEKEPRLVPNDWDDHQGNIIPWTRIAAGEGNVYGIKKDGSLWVWGTNTSGELGLSEGAAQYDTPQIITKFDIDLKGSAWRQIVAGSRHAVGIDMRGNMWTWGATSGKRGAKNETSAPAIAWTFTDGDTYGSAFTLLGGHGGESTMAISSNGRLLLFGINGQGQLGNGVHHPGNSFGDNTGDIVWMPTIIENDTAADTGDPDIDNLWVSVVTGGSTSFGIQNDGQLWAWGQNRYGQHGQGSDEAAFGNNPWPRLIERPNE